MINIATETDIEMVRQVALILERENARLHTRLEKLTAALARAEGKDASALQLEIEQLKQTLDARNQALFGRSSEKRSPNGKRGDQETTPKRGHGPSEQPRLPIEEVVVPLDQADRVCPSCGGELTEMAGQYEESDEVTVVERSFKIVRTKRQKYRCACGGTVETALAPARLIPGGRYSIDFAIEVIIAKYCDHLPLSRQVRQMQRQGLVVTPQTLWDQLFAAYGHLEPTYRALQSVVLASPVVGADETTWQMMETGKSKTWWAWSISSPRAVYYDIHPSRSTEAAASILGDYSGTVLCDGYAAYSSLAKSRRAARDGPPPFELAHCWAHVRRRFIEAEPHDARATRAIELIGKLYEVEAEARQAPDGDLSRRRAELRQERSRATVAELRSWMVEQRALPKSALGKAIRYADGIWPGLCRFLEDAAVDLDNNQTERAIRGVAVGRKNHYGSRSLRGTRVAALCYTLIESAKLVGVEPRVYVSAALRRAIEKPGTVTLPQDLLAS